MAVPSCSLNSDRLIVYMTSCSYVTPMHYTHALHEVSELPVQESGLQLWNSLLGIKCVWLNKLNLDEISETLCHAQCLV